MNRHRPEVVSPHVGGEVAAWLRGMTEGGVTRRDFVVRCGALGISLSSIATLLAACGSGSGPAAQTTQQPTSMSTESPASIKVLGWYDYVPAKVIRDFEQKTGIKVDLTTFSDIDTMIRRMKAGRVFDVVWAGDWSLTVLLRSRLVQPLDMRFIPNFKYVDAIFQQPSYDPGTGGARYSVPYMFGSIGIGVRVDKVDKVVNSWAPLFDPANKGKISMLDGSREVMAAGLFAVGCSPNTTDQNELDKATAALIRQKRLILGYDSVDMLPRMVKGQPYTHCWDGDAIDAMNKLGISKIKYVLPAEGYQLWADAMAVPANARSPYGGHLFLNHLLDPPVAAACANAYGYQPAVVAADPLIKSLVQRAMRPSPEILQKGSFTKNLDAFDAAYQKAYEKVRRS